jgi:holo-[acyl-carrier protein] synthase
LEVVLLILGVGVDIVEISRIKNALKKHTNFIDRLFEKTEIEYFNRNNNKPESIAGSFAAKEAVSKAFGTGFRGFDFRDICVHRTNLGKPTVILKGKAELFAKKYGNYIIHLSISHEINNAIAFAVMEVDDIEGCQC